MSNEVYKAFEEVVNRNLKMVIDHSNQTRVLVKENGDKVEHLEKALLEKDKIIAELRLQLSNVQQKLWQ